MAGSPWVSGERRVYMIYRQSSSLDIFQSLSATFFVKPGPWTQIPKAQPQPSQTQIPISSKGTGADTKILRA